MLEKIFLSWACWCRIEGPVAISTFVFHCVLVVSSVSLWTAVLSFI